MVKALGGPFKDQREVRTSQARHREASSRKTQEVEGLIRRLNWPPEASNVESIT
jgi:hypothetical protein